MAVVGLDPLETIAQAELFEVAHHGGVVGEDVVVEALDRLAADLEGDDLAPGLIAPLEDGDGVTVLLQPLRGSEPRHPCPHDADVHGMTAPGSSAGTRFMRPRRASGIPNVQRRTSPRIVVGMKITACATIA